MLRAKELTVQATAILAQLAESGGTPESHIYIQLGMNLRDYELVRGVLQGCGFIAITGNFVELTEAGQKAGDEVNARLAK